MASLVTRRQSAGSPPPRILIPPRHISKDELDSSGGSVSSSGDVSPSVESLEPCSPVSTPPVSGGVSPGLQPITPPVITRKHDKILQIGKYLLVDQLENQLFKAVDTQTNEEKICKVFTQEMYRSKIATYCRLYENSSVVEISEIIRGKNFVYVFFDKHYGDLHSYVRNKKRLKEEEAISIYRQIAQAIAQCHECGVVIRDLKLRKFVFTDPARTKIQLEGLEDSHILEDEEDDTLHDKQGCPAYVSPEILERAQHGYSGKASDQWSSGVMLYTMLAGRYPFQEIEPTKLFEKIKLGHFSIPSHVSSKARCLVRNLLRREASDRLTAEEVLQHPWLKLTSVSHFVNTRTATSSSGKELVDDHLVPCV